MRWVAYIALLRSFLIVVAFIPITTTLRAHFAREEIISGWVLGQSGKVDRHGVVARIVHVSVWSVAAPFTRIRFTG